MSFSKIPRFQHSSKTSDDDKAYKIERGSAKTNMIKEGTKRSNFISKSNSVASSKKSKHSISDKQKIEPKAPKDSLAKLQSITEIEPQSLSKENELSKQIANLVKSTLDLDALPVTDENTAAYSVDINKMIHEETQNPISLENEAENELLYEYEPSEDSLLYARLNRKTAVSADCNSFALSFTLQHLEINPEFIDRKRANLLFNLCLPNDNGRKTYTMNKSVLIKPKIDFNLNRRFPLSSNLDFNSWFDQLLQITIDNPGEWCCKGVVSLERFKNKTEFQKKIPMWTINKYNKQQDIFVGDLHLNSQLLNYNDEDDDGSSAQQAVQDVDSVSSIESRSVAKKHNANPDTSLLSDNTDLLQKLETGSKNNNKLTIYIARYHSLSECEDAPIFCCLKLLPSGQPIQTLCQPFPFHFNFEISLPFIPNNSGFIEVWQQRSTNVFIGMCKLSFLLHSNCVELMFPSTNLSIINPITSAYMGSLQVALGYGNAAELDQQIKMLHLESLNVIKEKHLVDDYMQTVDHHQKSSNLGQLHNSWDFVHNNSKNAFTSIALLEKNGTDAKVGSSNININKYVGNDTLTGKNKSTAISDSLKSLNGNKSTNINSVPANKSTSVNPDEDSSTSANTKVKPTALVTMSALDQNELCVDGILKMHLINIYPLSAFEDRNIEDFESQNSNKTIVHSSSFYLTFNWYPDCKSSTQRTKKIVEYKNDDNNCINFHKTVELPVILSNTSILQFKRRKQTLKLWRKNIRGEFLIAFTIIDLYYLFDGLDSLEQWLDLVDSNGIVLGHILVKLEVDENILKSTTKEINFTKDVGNAILGTEITQYDLESIYSESNHDQIQQYLQRLNNK
eukprot:NODE_392_length_9456_cov_0.345517.p2 type:complete len:849 gc:universal NODE_392_length_9456_cov_0.345517:8367-5821(-)